MKPAEVDRAVKAAGFLAGPGEPGLVSIIIPTYNRARVVRETIDSILASTYANVEAVVVDDGSTDGTRAVVGEYSDPRVRYFHKPNGGMSSARNFGLELARGEYIAFLDSDDTWLPWKLAAQMELFRRHPEVGLIWTDMSAFTNAGEIVQEQYLRTYYTAYGRVTIEDACTLAGTLGDLSSEAPPALRDRPYWIGSIFRLMFIGNLVHPSTAVVTRERLRMAGPFQPEITGPGGEDYHFYYRVTERGPVAFLDVPTALYRVGDPSQLSSGNLAQARGNMNVVMHWLPRAGAEWPASVVRRRLASAHKWLGTENLYAGNPRLAVGDLWRSLRLQPFQPRVAALLIVSLLPKRALPVLRAAKHAVLGAGDSSDVEHAGMHPRVPRTSGKVQTISGPMRK